jgi:hypothetical protein
MMIGCIVVSFNMMLMLVEAGRLQKDSFYHFLTIVGYAFVIDFIVDIFIWKITSKLTFDSPMVVLLS